MDDARLRTLLETLPARLSTPERIALDPVSFPRRYEDAVDREVTGLVAASLAYGRIEAFRPKVEQVLSKLGPGPGRRLAELDRRSAATLFQGFTYRFHRGPDVARLALAIGDVVRSDGSLGAYFDRVSEGGRLPFREGLARFVRGLREREGEAGTLLSFHLLPDPATGSACKRLCLFLRWMVRPEDGIDFGLWRTYRPSDLVVPLDVHVARAGRLLGFTTRRSPDWRMAEEITAGLARFDPSDPLRFDFHLSHLGMLREALLDGR